MVPTDHYIDKRERERDRQYGSTMSASSEVTISYQWVPRLWMEVRYRQAKTRARFETTIRCKHLNTGRLVRIFFGEQYHAMIETTFVRRTFGPFDHIMPFQQIGFLWCSANIFNGFLSNFCVFLTEPGQANRSHCFSVFPSWYMGYGFGGCVSILRTAIAPAISRNFFYVFLTATSLRAFLL